MAAPQNLSLPGMEPPPAVGAAVPAADVLRVASALPPALRLGTSSWSFPGWAGIVYDRDYRQPLLAQAGLAAYARHPLLRAVGVDRTYYAPMSEAELAAYRDAVPADFRFVLKAHEHCTTARFPQHRRHGALAGCDNPRFLDVRHATERVVMPAVAALGETLGALVFQFPPQPREALGGPRGFAGRLARFLEALPVGPLYAVEIRDRALLTHAYLRALDAGGATHCLGVHPRMPAPAEQAQFASEAMTDALVARWNLGHGLAYEAARSRYAPFDAIVDEDVGSREALAGLCIGATASDRPAYVLVNNKAEGSAPLSALRLAEAVVRRRQADTLRPFRAHGEVP
jgi:uncharacterized protein YecE (DUF72 family)